MNSNVVGFTVDESASEASKELVAMYIDLREDLTRFVFSKVKSADDAEDVVQQLYFQITKISEEKLSEINDFRRYLFGIANILSLKHLQAKGKDSRYLSMDESAFPAEKSDEASEPSLDIESSQTMAILKKTLDEMPAKRRQVFLYYRFKNMAVKEIAEELDMTISAVEKHIVRALFQCRENLKEGGNV